MFWLYFRRNSCYRHDFDIRRYVWKHSITGNKFEQCLSIERCQITQKIFFLKNALTSLVLIISIRYLYLKWSSFNGLSRELTNNANLVTNQVSNYNFDIRPPQNEAIWPAKNLNLLQMTNFWLLHLIELSLTNKTGYKTILVALSGAHNTPNTAHRSYLPNLHKKSFPTKISLT